MSLNYNITEGFKIGDLEDIVKPTISIDEFESKIDDEAIVVAFSLGTGGDQPAKDLAEFIEGGKNEVLDAEVSPGPDTNGNYLLFVEFSRSDEFPQNLKNVLESLRSLTLVSDWKYTYYGVDNDEKEFSVKNVENDIRLEKKKRDDTPAIIKESFEFFKESDLFNMEINDKNITFFNRIGGTKMYENIAFGDIDTVFSVLKLDNQPIKLDAESLRECKGIQSLLGNNWNVVKINNNIIIANSTDNRIMVVQ